jgi:hypothetical protein
MRSVLRVKSGALIFSVMLTAACGDWQPPSPVDPSPWSNSPSGATISGTVQGIGNALTLGATTMTVTVEGTDISVTVDGNGRFVLNSVPTGTISLRFTAPGADANLTIENIGTADTVNLVLTVQGSTVTVLFEEVVTVSGKVELEGLISEINPEGSERTWIVRGKRVSVPEGVEIRAGSTALEFDDLEIGQRIHVRGATVNDVVVATLVIVQGWDDDDTDEDDGEKGQNVNVKGNASAVVPGCPNVQFKVGGWTVDTDSSTDWKKGGCAGLVEGSYLHIKGRVQSSGRVLAEWVMFQ